MKKLLKFTLAASMAMSAIPLQAQANEAGGDVIISENGTEVTIGNRCFSDCGLTVTKMNFCVLNSVVVVPLFAP